MAELFAVDDPRADAAYVNIRAAVREGSARARANCEELWRDFEPYASAHFLAEFPRRFHQRWFEMYLAVALVRAGLRIECPKENAPDVRVQYDGGRVLWLEAIAPTGGGESNPDRVVYPRQQPDQPSVAYRVPTDQVTLRVSGALHDKAARLQRYRDRGIIAPDQQALVAINVNRVPHGFYDAERYGLAATYGLGPQYVVFNRDTGQAVDEGFQHRSELQRGSGAPVDAAPFLHKRFPHVTGALISSTDAANCPKPFGLDFMLLPNPNAEPAYTERQIALGREWRLRPAAGGEVYDVVEVVEHQRQVGDASPLVPASRGESAI
jgi:hypothetical protein